jgi:ketosteroid isomerase-like protein
LFNQHALNETSLSEGNATCHPPRPPTYSRQFAVLPLRLEDYEVAEFYQTVDPEVVIAEMRTKGTLTTTGQSFAATAIQVLRIREGRIVLFRDFANPRTLEDVISQPRPES